MKKYCKDCIFKRPIPSLDATFKTFLTEDDIIGHGCKKVISESHEPSGKITRVFNMEVNNGYCRFYKNILLDVLQLIIFCLLFISFFIWIAFMINWS